MRTPVFIIFIALIASGCSQQKRLVRLLEKYPQPTEIEYIPGDTVFSPDSIPVFIPGDTVIDSRILNVEVDIPDTSITLKMGAATFTASIRDNTLYAEASQPDTTYIVPSDSAIQVRVDSVIIRPPPLIKEVKVKSKALPYWIGVAIVEFLLLIVFIFLLIKLKR